MVGICRIIALESLTKGIIICLKKDLHRPTTTGMITGTPMTTIKIDFKIDFQNRQWAKVMENPTTNDGIKIMTEAMAVIRTKAIQCTDKGPTRRNRTGIRNRTSSRITGIIPWYHIETATIVKMITNLQGYRDFDNT